MSINFLWVDVLRVIVRFSLCLQRGMGISSASCRSHEQPHGLVSDTCLHRSRCLICLVGWRSLALWHLVFEISCPHGQVRLSTDPLLRLMYGLHVRAAHALQWI